MKIDAAMPSTDSPATEFAIWILSGIGTRMAATTSITSRSYFSCHNLELSGASDAADHRDLQLT